MTAPAAFPLSWPPQFKRTTSRQTGSFKTSLAGALKNVEGSLRRFAVDSRKRVESLVMSSNVTLGAAKPSDPGVAVWFVWDGLSVCIPVDRYTTVEANLQAIHHIIEARRVELRHGTLQLVRATFAGFAALPAPAKSWRAVLDVSAHLSVTDQRRIVAENYRRFAITAHPDRGGSTEAMSELNAARAAAEAELGQ